MTNNAYILRKAVPLKLGVIIVIFIFALFLFNQSVNASAINTTLLIEISANPIIANPNQLLTLTADVTRATNDTLIYEWDIQNDGIIDVAKNKSSNSDSISVSYNQSGIYDVTIFVNDTSTNISNMTSTQILVGNPSQFFQVSIPKNEYWLDEQIVISLTLPSKAFVAYSLKFPDSFVLSGYSNKSSTILFSPIKKGSYTLNAFFTYFNVVYNTTYLFSVKENKFFLELAASKNSIEEGNAVDFTAIVHRPTSTTLLYRWDFENDGFIDAAGTTNLDTIISSHNFTHAGNYTVNFSVYDMNTTNSTSTISFIEVKKFIPDTESPRILILSPHDNMKIKEQKLRINYNVFDKSEAECSLYFIDGKGFLELIETQHIQTKGKGTFEAKDIPKGIYKWQIECIDSFFNKGTSNLTTSFIDSFNTTNNTAEDIVAEESVNGQKQSHFSDITKKIDSMIVLFEIDDGNKQIREKIDFKKQWEEFKKEIENADSQLSNLDSQQLSAKEKEAKEKEIKENIQKKFRSLPESLSITDSKEYVKYALDSDVEKILSSYLNSKNMVLKKSSLKSYAEKIKEMQEEVVVTTKFTKGWINFMNGSKTQFTFIEKDISSSPDKVLEVIPKEIAESSNEIQVFQQFIIIEKDPIFQIQAKDGKIHYLLKKDVNEEDIKKIDSIIFEEPSQVLNEESNNIFGFVTAPLAPFEGSWKWVLLFVGFLVIILFYLIIFFNWNINNDIVTIFKNHILQKGKRPVLDQRVLYHIQKMQKAIENRNENEIVKHYQNIQQIYKHMNQLQKSEVYNTSQQLREGAIVSFFAKKLEEAMDYPNDTNKQQFLNYYQTIYSLYKHLPSEEKQRYYGQCMDLYEKIIR